MAQDMDTLNMDTLFGDLRDAILDRLRATPKPWTAMSETEQREMIEDVEHVSRHLVTSAVHLVAANGAPSIPAQIFKAAIKDEIQVLLKIAPSHPLRHDLLDAIGDSGLLVIANAEQYMGERGPADPDPDEPDLPGTGGDDNVRPMRGRGRPPKNDHSPAS